MNYASDYEELDKVINQKAIWLKPNARCAERALSMHGLEITEKIVHATWHIWREVEAESEAISQKNWTGSCDARETRLS